MKLTKSFLILILVMFLAGTSFAADQKAKQPQTSGKGFGTAKAAADALIEAAASYNIQTLLEIFGPEGKDIVSSADPVRDKTNAAAFVALAKEMMKLDTSTPNRAIIFVGPNEWPLPVPIVKRGAQWYFDTKAGRDEILYRRIGANELDAIRVCQRYVSAQREYALQAHDGVNQYAQHIISTSGKQDGLYWKNEDGTSEGPISEGVARALAEGYTFDISSAFHGYYFKILKGQGPAAPLGRIDYVINDIMIGGFALVAVPVEYRVTGVKTFIVSNDGIVYEKDLGANSLEIAKKMELYNPDKSWKPTRDQAILAESKE